MIPPTRCVLVLFFLLRGLFFTVYVLWSGLYIKISRVVFSSYKRRYSVIVIIDLRIEYLMVR